MDHISLDLVRVTEAAAILGSAWIGSGDKKSADKAATDAMRDRLNRMEFSAKIAIGEGEKDKSYGLYAGEHVGKLAADKKSKVYALALDPIDGTRPTVNSGPEAISVIAAAEEGAMFSSAEFYMNKLAYGPAIARKTRLKITDPLPETIQKVSAATGKEIPRIVVCVLERPRHEALIAQLRKIGVRIKLIQDCDISGAIACCLPPSGIDILYGIGGTAEGVITACAMKCLRGGFEAQLVRAEKIIEPKVYSMEDLVKGPCVFAATGVTNGSLLKGVRFTEQGTAVTNSVFMRSESGTVRWLTVYHGN